MAKTLSRFYIRKQDENKETATLFFRVQNKEHKIDSIFPPKYRLMCRSGATPFLPKKTGCVTEKRISSYTTLLPKSKWRSRARWRVCTLTKRP